MAEWKHRVRRLEAGGFDHLCVPEHLAPGVLSPMIALASAAEQSASLRLRTLVINAALRPPAMLAREASSLDLLSVGRFELGLGAGYRKDELERAGVAFGNSRQRVDALAEVVAILRSAWSGTPVVHTGRQYRLCGHVDAVSAEAARIPIIIGGNRRRILELAGREADSVCLVGSSQSASGELLPSHFTHEGLERQTSWIECVAASRRRPDALHRAVVLQHVELTNQRRAAATRLTRWFPGLTADDLCASPYVLIGSKRHIREQIRVLQERHRISDITVLGSSWAAMEEVLR